MPVISPLSDEQIPETMRPVFAALRELYGEVPGIFRVMVHAPEVVLATLQMNRAVRKDFPDKLRELAYLKTSTVNRCDYCLRHHQVVGAESGLTESQLAALDNFAESDAFNDEEKAVLRFADQLAREGRVDAATKDALMDFLSESQLIKLAAVVGLANWTNWFAETFAVEFP